MMVIRFQNIQFNSEIYETHSFTDQIVAALGPIKQQLHQQNLCLYKIAIFRDPECNLNQKPVLLLTTLTMWLLVVYWRVCVRPKNERIFEYLQSTNKWLSRAPLFRSVANGSNGFKILYIAYVHTSIMCPSEQSVSVFHIFCHFSSICTYSFLCILYVCRIALLYMVSLWFLYIFSTLTFALFSYRKLTTQ